MAQQEKVRRDQIEKEILAKEKAAKDDLQQRLDNEKQEKEALLKRLEMLERIAADNEKRLVVEQDRHKDELEAKSL